MQGFMELFLLWAMRAQEYMAIFFNIDGHHTLGSFERAGGK